MKKYKPYLNRVDLVKNQVEREELREQEAKRKRSRSIQEQNRQRWLKYQEQLRSELAARYFHSVQSTGGESFSNTRSLSFDGTDDFVNIADADNLSFGNGSTDSAFSISAWIKPVDNARFRIAFKWGTVLREYYFQIAGGGALQVSINSTASIYIGRNGQTTISENVWSHVVCTYDGSGNKNNVNIYLNGVLDNSTAISSGTYTAMSNTLQPFEIGRYNGGSYADGSIDEVSVFNTELSQSDITAIYGGGTPSDISSISGLVSWWRFEGTGTTATDNGSGGNDGTINGATYSTDVPG